MTYPSAVLSWGRLENSGYESGLLVQQSPCGIGRKEESNIPNPCCASKISKKDKRMAAAVISLRWCISLNIQLWLGWPHERLYFGMPQSRWLITAQARKLNHSKEIFAANKIASNLTIFVLPVYMQEFLEEAAVYCQWILWIELLPTLCNGPRTVKCGA